MPWPTEGPLISHTYFARQLDWPPRGARQVARHSSLVPPSDAVLMHTLEPGQPELFEHAAVQYPSVHPVGEPTTDSGMHSALDENEHWPSCKHGEPTPPSRTGFESGTQAPATQTKPFVHCLHDSPFWPHANEEPRFSSRQKLPAQQPVHV